MSQKSHYTLYFFNIFFVFIHRTSISLYNIIQNIKFIVSLVEPNICQNECLHDNGNKVHKCCLEGIYQISSQNQRRFRTFLGLVLVYHALLFIHKIGAFERKSPQGFSNHYPVFLYCI